MVAIISTINSDMPCTKLQNEFCSFMHVLNC